jgi:hypothetical protein
MSSFDRPCHVLDGHVRVHPVLVIEVQGVHAKPLQRSLHSLLDVVRTAGDPAPGLALGRIDVEAELAGDHHLALERGECLAHQLLVGVGTVDLGGIEEGDAAVHCGADQRNHLLPVRGGAEAAGHAHAAQPDCRDLQAAGAQGALVHISCSCGRREGRPALSEGKRVNRSVPATLAAP